MIRIISSTTEEAKAVEPFQKLLASETGERAIHVLQELWQLWDQSRWKSTAEEKPKDFVSVIGNMTDAGDFPATRECYVVGGRDFFFPALGEIHPVDYWMEMPKFNKDGGETDGYRIS